MTSFYELYPRCSSGQEWIWFLQCLPLLKRNWPALLKLAKAQQPSHSPGMEAWVLMPVLALFHMCLHSIQTHAGGVAVVSWHFPRGLHFIIEKCVICANTHMQMHSSCIVAYVHILNLQSFEVTKPGGLATNCSRRSGRWGGPVCFSKENTLILHSSHKLCGLCQTQSKLVHAKSNG